MSSSKPTRRLDIQDAERANLEILVFSAKLEAEGERAWFEVWYPYDTAETFDAVEVIGGVIHTLPPYEELS